MEVPDNGAEILRIQVLVDALYASTEQGREEVATPLNGEERAWDWSILSTSVGVPEWT